MCFAPQRRALFRHLNFQKWSEPGVFCTLWLRNVLRSWGAFNFFTCKCASRHNGVLFFDIATSKSAPKLVFCTFWLANVLRATTACSFSTSQLLKVLRSWGVLYILTWKCASRHNGVQFFISHLASWLCTRRFSEPTCRPSGASNIRKTQCFALSNFKRNEKHVFWWFSTGWYIWHFLWVRYGGYGTVGTVGTVQWVRWVRYSGYSGYGTVGTVRWVRYGACRYAPTVPTVPYPPYRTHRTSRTVPSVPPVPYPPYPPYRTPPYPPYRTPPYPPYRTPKMSRYSVTLSRYSMTLSRYSVTFSGTVRGVRWGTVRGGTVGTVRGVRWVRIPAPTVPYPPYPPYRTTVPTVPYPLYPPYPLYRTQRTHCTVPTVPYRTVPTVPYPLYPPYRTTAPNVPHPSPYHHFWGPYPPTEHYSWNLISFATFLPFRAPGSSFFWLFLFLLLFSSLALPIYLCFSSVHIVGSLTAKLPSITMLDDFNPIVNNRYDYADDF